LRIRSQATAGVPELCEIAESGDKMSIDLLCMLAVKAIMTLNELGERRPHLMRRIARNDIAWPGLIGRKREIQIQNRKTIEILRLGKCGSVLSDRKWQLSAPSTQIAISQRIFKEDWSEKPPLTPKKKRQFFEALWTEMLAKGIVPEETGRMASLGASAIGKKSTSRGMSEQTPGMRSNDVRAENKRQVWKAFDHLVPHGNRTK
jgi:hypothetical protein